MIDPQTQEYLSQRTLEIAEDVLRQRIIEDTPALAAEAHHLAQVLRESVDLERTKRRLETGSGSIELYPYKRKKDSSQPDLVGKGQVGGRNYKAAAWLKDDNALRIALIQEKTNG